MKESDAFVATIRDLEHKLETALRANEELRSELASLRTMSRDDKADFDHGFNEPSYYDGSAP